MNQNGKGGKLAIRNLAGYDLKVERRTVMSKREEWYCEARTTSNQR